MTTTGCIALSVLLVLLIVFAVALIAARNLIETQTETINAQSIVIEHQRRIISAQKDAIWFFNRMLSGGQEQPPTDQEGTSKWKM